MAVTEPTLAAKDALETPAATVTFPGTVTIVLLLETATTMPPLPAAALSVSTHAAVPGALTLTGVQARPLSVTGVGWTTVTAPPVAEAGMEFPRISAAITFPTVIGTLVLTLPVEMAIVAVAAPPLASALVSLP